MVFLGKILTFWNLINMIAKHCIKKSPNLWKTFQKCGANRYAHHAKHVGERV